MGDNNLLPGKLREKRASVDDQEDDDDDRADALPSACRNGARDVGLGIVKNVYGIVGLHAGGSSQKAKETPSPFVGGPRIDVSRAASTLGVIARQAPVVRQAPQPKTRTP